MIKVLFIAGQLGGGGAERQLALFLENARDQLEPSCLVLNGGGVWHEPVRGMCARFHVSHWDAPPARAVEFFQVTRQWRPDLIHCWHTFPFVYPLVSSPLHRSPIIANIRGDLTVDGESGRAGFPWYYRMLRLVDVVVSNSAHSLAALERYGVRPRRSQVIGNGIEPAAGRADRSHKPPIRVVGVGSLRPIKNWRQLIRVGGELVRAGRPISLVIYGEGSQRRELESLCSECGLDPRRTLPGYVPDLRRRLAEADVLTHCSLSEGLPNVILEALAEGLAVVASDLEVCRDLQHDSGCLDLFPINDDEALRERLEHLIADPALRVARGRPGPEFIRHNFGCAAMARRYLELYEALMSPSANRGRQSEA